jgi:predicted HTH domain antitoxin
MIIMSDTYQLTIELPQTVKVLLPDGEQEAKQLIAVKLYQNGSVSSGRAAEIAGMNRIDFETYLSKQKIPISNLTFEQVMADVASLDEEGGTATTQISP